MFGTADLWNFGLSE